MLEKYSVDLRCTVNVQLHPGWGDNILDIAGDILDAAPIFDAKSLHSRRYSQTDLIFSSRLSNVEKSIVTQRLITD